MTPDWRTRAACSIEDARLFDPPEIGEGNRSLLRRYDAATRICRRCAVQVECLTDAHEQQDNGWRAGLYLVRGNVVSIDEWHLSSTKSARPS